MFLKKTDFIYFRLVYLSGIYSKSFSNFQNFTPKWQLLWIFETKQKWKLGVANMKDPIPIELFQAPQHSRCTKWVDKPMDFTNLYLLLDLVGKLQLAIFHKQCHEWNYYLIRWKRIVFQACQHFGIPEEKILSVELDAECTSQGLILAYQTTIQMKGFK